MPVDTKGDGCFLFGRVSLKLAVQMMRLILAPAILRLERGTESLTAPPSRPFYDGGN
jgi:hypothetical protein